MIGAIDVTKRMEMHEEALAWQCNVSLRGHLAEFGTGDMPYSYFGIVKILLKDMHSPFPCKSDS